MQNQQARRSPGRHPGRPHSATLADRQGRWGPQGYRSDGLRHVRVSVAQFSGGLAHKRFKLQARQNHPWDLRVAHAVWGVEVLHDICHSFASGSVHPG